MPLTRFVLLPAILPALLLATTAGHATAQAYPSKPIRIVVSATPGGGVDTSTRIVGQGMAEAGVAEPLDQTAAYIRAEIAKWAKVVKAAKISVE